MANVLTYNTVKGHIFVMFKFWKNMLFRTWICDLAKCLHINLWKPSLSIILLSIHKFVGHIHFSRNQYENINPSKLNVVTVHNIYTRAAVCYENRNRVISPYIFKHFLHLKGIHVYCILRCLLKLTLNYSVYLLNTPNIPYFKSMYDECCCFNDYTCRTTPTCSLPL